MIHSGGGSVKLLLAARLAEDGTGSGGDKSLQLNDPSRSWGSDFFFIIITNVVYFRSQPLLGGTKAESFDKVHPLKGE